MHSVYEPHHTCNTHDGYFAHLAPPNPLAIATTFLAVHDAVLAMFDASCAGRRQAVVISALLYPAQKLGEAKALATEFQTRRRQICEAIRGFYCIRSIQTTLQELRAGGFIAYRTDGEHLYIRLTDRWRRWIEARCRQLEKCKIAQTLNTKEGKNQNHPPRTWRAAYVPAVRVEPTPAELIFDHAKGESYEMYAARVGVPMSPEDWLDGRAC